MTQLAQIQLETKWMELVLECKSGDIVHAFLPPYLMFHFKDFHPFALIFFYVFLLCTFLILRPFVPFFSSSILPLFGFFHSVLCCVCFPQGANLFFLFPVSPEDTEILYILSSSAKILISYISPLNNYLL